MAIANCSFDGVPFRMFFTDTRYYPGAGGATADQPPQIAGRIFLSSRTHIESFHELFTLATFKRINGTTTYRTHIEFGPGPKTLVAATHWGNSVGYTAVLTIFTPRGLATGPSGVYEADATWAITSTLIT